MNAEIIAVGSEMLTPSRLDTNSLFLTRKLGELGIDVVRKVIVGDDLARLTEEVRRALAASEIVVMTGGLGPTLDDLSREAASGATGRGLAIDPAIVEWLEARFRRAGRAMVDSNRRQAYVLDGAEVLPNPRGTAPGQWLRLDGRALILLPGPPRELEPMFENECLPRLRTLPSPYRYHTFSLRIALLPESEVDERIAPIYSPEPQVMTTILAAPGDIQVHLKARAESEEEARAIAEALGRKVDAELGDAVFSHANEVLEEAVGRLLRERGQTLAAAESCTGGLLAEKITAFPGSSDYFTGSFVTYTNEAKTNWLGVDAALIERHGAVSAETAEAMARAVREKACSTYGLSITGFAGPTGGTEQAPVGTVFIGLADGNTVSVLRRRFGSERDRVRMLAALHALEMLRRKILNLPDLQSS